MDDPSVSRLHCSLSLRSGGIVVIADVGSANGTYVNEDLLGREEARSLSTGDVVGVGDFKLTVSEIA
jgi:pSer/pThr/pTyr-binding forkhead associated (FHA) protein